MTSTPLFRHFEPPAAVPDPFARDVFSVDTLNISHVRVAGIGGLGLVLVAATVVLQYQLLIAAMSVGLLGGVIGGAWLIHHRKVA